jgi:hypothetical protein
MVGPSGTGKTYSALRLATGMQRVNGGEIYCVDTESNRMLHYAPLPGEKADPTRGKFAFRHVPFASPYPSLKYLAAIRHCVGKGAKQIIIDSCTHEHTGVGGVLEQHLIEVERLCKENGKSPDQNKMSAWGPAKIGRQRLIDGMLTEFKVSCIFCFRAKEKIKMATKKEKAAGAEAVIPMGYMALGGEEFIFEMTVKFVLLPGARGIPTWESEFKGEQEMMKIPEQFLHIFERPAPLSEEIGQQMAEWAAGGDVKLPSEEEFAAGLAAAKSAKSIEEISAVVESFKGKPWTKVQRKHLTEAITARKTELAPKS